MSTKITSDKVPSVGEVNGDRNNFSFSEWSGQPNQYGACPMVVDFKNRKSQPPTYTRGFIARVYFYMHNTYGLPISKKQQRLFTAWNKQYQADEWEKVRFALIAEIQGGSSRFAVLDNKKHGSAIDQN